MGLLSLLKKVAMVGAVAAPAIADSFAPGSSILMRTVLGAVIHAESKFGPGTGDQKREAVQEALAISAPAVIQLIELQTGRDLADEALFAHGLAHMQEGMVDILNAFGALPQAEKTA